jgi:hypothetical protein
MKDIFTGILNLGSWEEQLIDALRPNKILDDNLYLDELIKRATLVKRELIILSKTKDCPDIPNEAKYKR